jgi:uncharacterized protein involved in exopolysaccharide biosynthesis
MTSAEPITIETSATPNWVVNANLLWDHRRLLARVAGVAMLLGIAAAFLLPKRYESTARLMPPESGGNSAMLAAVLGHAGDSLGSLGGLAGGLLGARSTGVLFLDLLHSRTIADRLIDRFDLQHLYHKRYRIDTVKRLSDRTVLTEDKKSGVISITVTDGDPIRARDIAQGYVDELNKLVVTSNTSSARRERLFIEQRLVTVQKDLESAQQALSEFSSTNTALDIKEQTRAMVDSAAKLQGELSVDESELGSLEQIYGPDNVRVRAARARIGALQSELNKIGGSSSPQSAIDPESYPTIRQLPRLAVPYANLYRRVRIEETVFELLSQQFEMARIEEAKDTPAVSVIDAPLIAEKHSFPPRRWVVLGTVAVALLLACVFVLIRESWHKTSLSDPRKVLALRITATFAKSRPQ